MSEALDNVVDSLPIGFFHYRLLVMCGLAFMADAMEVSLLSFLSTCVGNEWGLSNLQRASITGVVFSGELLGGLFWGPIADRFGRQKAFLFASSLIVICGFLSGAAPTYEWLLFFRAVVGFGVGGLTVPFDLLAEFMPTSGRGKFLIYIEYFWTFGSLFVAGVAWAALDNVGWRGLSYITAVPVTLSSIASFLYLPESPRWLLIKGRHLEAEEVVKNAAAVSGFVLSPFSLSPHLHFESNPEQCDAANGDYDKEQEPVKDATFFDLVRTPQIRKISIPLWIVWTSFGFTYYGIILFVSRLYTTDSSPIMSEGSSSESYCTFDYEPIFINACAELLGVFFAAIFIDRIGRTRTQGAFFAIAGVAVCLMGYQLPSVSTLVYISMLARLGAMASTSATWVATSELYPTEMRGTGHSVCSSLAKLGSFVVPYFVISSVSFSTVGLTLACVNFLAAAVALFMLRETTGQKLDVGLEPSNHISSSNPFTLCPTQPQPDRPTHLDNVEWTNPLFNNSKWAEEKDWEGKIGLGK